MVTSVPADDDFHSFPPPFLVSLLEAEGSLWKEYFPPNFHSAVNPGCLPEVQLFLISPGKQLGRERDGSVRLRRYNTFIPGIGWHAAALPVGRCLANSGSLTRDD